MHGYYYGKRSHATADLKRTAHAVRERIDKLPIINGVNPRLQRYITRASQAVDGQSPPREPPYLEPRARHRWAWSWR